MNISQLVDRSKFALDTHDAAQRARTSDIVLTRMLGALELKEGEGKVLEIGTGSGLVAAVLGKLADRVYTVESNPDRARAARARLAEHGNVTVLQAEGEQGVPDEAPFDAILISARVPSIPPELRRQLAVGGHLVAPVGLYRVRQELVRITRVEGNQFVKENLGELRFATELGDILIAIGAAKPKDVAAAREEDGALDEVLLARAQVREDDLVMARSLQYGLPVGDVEQLLLGADASLIQKISKRYLQRGELLPLKLEDGELTLATTDPSQDPQTVAMSFRAQSVKTVLVSRTDFKRLRAALELHREEGVEVDHAEGGPELLAEGVTNKHVRLFEAMLLEAVGANASDIHLEQYGLNTRVRMRIDGVLEDMPRFSLDQEDHEHIINILKVSAGMDITEHFLPQGGRFSRSVGSRNIDVRAQIQPSFDGESAVIRLLSNAQDAFEVGDLHFPRDAQDTFDRLVDEPSGLMLVTGPTGSGKTTTLYAALLKVAADRERKGLTIEDPVEYSMFGIQQVQVSPRFGFADAMASFVRQDPDIIFLGEIRDTETALETLRASQTGHLVLSTVHCNDSVDSVQRLYDLGMADSSIASELMAVLNQRLVRRNCPNCRASERPEQRLIDEFFPTDVPDDLVFVHGRGCVRCRGRGTQGRLPLVELWVLDPVTRAAIARHMPVDELRELAVERGLIRLKERGLELVRRGEVSLAELRRELGTELLERP
jgi:type IV pilus assembly protein PilB